jgi:hypothetical protein
MARPKKKAATSRPSPPARPGARTVPEFSVRDCRAEALVARSAFLSVARLSVGELRKRGEAASSSPESVSFWEAAALSLAGRAVSGDSRALEAFAKVATSDGLFRQAPASEGAIVAALYELRELLRNSSTTARDVVAWYASAAASVGNEPEAIAILERAAKTSAEILRLQPEALGSTASEIVFDFTGWAPPALNAGQG